MIKITHIRGVADAKEMAPMIRTLIKRFNYQAKVKLVDAHLEITNIKFQGKWLEKPEVKELARKIKNHWGLHWFKVNKKIKVI